MEMKNKSLILFLVAVATTSIIIDSCAAQFPPLTPSSPSSNTSCIIELSVACQGTASSSCCSALEKAYKDQYDCLCLYAQSQNATSLLGGNSTSVPDLLVECKVINSTVGVCTNSTLPFSPIPLTPFTPGLSSSPPPGSGDAVMVQTMWSGMSGLASFILFYFVLWY